MTRSTNCVSPAIRKAAWAAALLSATSACYIGGWDDPAQAQSKASTASCEPLQQLFTESLWSPVMAQSCTPCHVQGGQAGSGALVLQPNDVTASYWATRSVARMTGANGESLLLVEVSGQMQHPVAVVIDPNSPTYAAFTQFATRALHNDADCNGIY